MSVPLNPAGIPETLKGLAQWVCWHYEVRNGKRTKAPINPKSNGRLIHAKTDDPTTWSAFDVALATCGRFPDVAGIGFCFAATDGLTGIDLDHVIDPDTGELTPAATEILERFKGTYAEISPSATGLRLFCYGKPQRSGKNSGKTKWLEVYSHPSNRYLTLTGQHQTGNALDITDQQDALDWLHHRFMESTGDAAKQPALRPAAPLDASDAALIKKATRAKNGPEFARLWAGDTSLYGNDDSAADLALCNVLTFWTNADADRIDRLFRQSGLMREKWDSQRGEFTYGKTTIARAIVGTGQGYSGRKGDAKPAEPAQTVPNKPTIHVRAGETHLMTDAAERYLIERDNGIFQRGDFLVRWAISKQETVHGLHRSDGVAVIKPIGVEHLLDRLSQHIDWLRWDVRTKSDQRANVPRDVALKMLERHGSWKFPTLVGIITAPTLRLDGSILSKPGYDVETGLLYVEQQPFPPLPENPTREEARHALDFITTEVLSGFPFVEPHHRAAALSAILSVTVRHILRHIPLHAFTAPKAGSGKSLLADCIALIGTGRPAAVLALSEDQTEMNKTITAILMQGDAVVNLDNIERGEMLAGREISKALTQEIYSGRVLGLSQTKNLPSSCLWLATGNQLQISGDMTRRVIPCEIDPECERPDEREFSRDLYQWIPEHRPQLIAAALTALRAYMVAGKPRQAIKPLGGFEDWSKLVRSALVWLGEADPLTGRDSIEQADPERGKLRMLLLAWHRAFGSLPTTCKEAVYKATPRIDPESREEILEASMLAGRYNQPKHL